MGQPQQKRLKKNEINGWENDNARKSENTSVQKRDGKEKIN